MTLISAEMSKMAQLIHCLTFLDKSGKITQKKEITSRSSTKRQSFNPSIKLLLYYCPLFTRITPPIENLDRLPLSKEIKMLLKTS